MPDGSDHKLDYFCERDTRLKRIYQARDTMEAEFVRGLLDAEGIPAVVQGAALEIALSPLLGGSTLPVVCVRQEDTACAEQVIARYQRGEIPSAGKPWTCPGCGEAIEGQFTECWKCGTARDVDAAPAIPPADDADEMPPDDLRRPGDQDDAEAH